MTEPFPVEKTKLCVGLFLASEAVFFALLILAYVYYKPAVSSGPTAASSLHPEVTAFYTAALIASSFTVSAAGREARRQAYGAFAGWMFATIGLGIIFLVGQIREYLDMLRHSVTVHRNIFGTSFYTLTGFHGFHVFVGLVCLLLVVLSAAFGQSGRKELVALEAVSWYWHFVDVVWIVIFSIVYLWTFL
ncbi:MAG TPA: cytochrome c oxidase subunit 3 [Bryobacteraceae bacterium]|nr:cytochrome c oxidase subunit 3 [Bryobacteraceae bacterium]